MPCIIEQSTEAFYVNTLNKLKQTCDICYEKIKQIPCFSCPYKPQGGMCMMVNSFPKLKISEISLILDILKIINSTRKIK